jgi:ATP-dependent RNA helicase DeaD
MADENPNRYTSSIDLTSRGQREVKQQRVMASLTEPEPALPDATVGALSRPMQQALKSAGWSSLMPVQQKAIPYILEGRDLIVQSRTGSGKTGAFLLPLFDLIDPAKKQTQALILCPTRELARQIHEEFERMRGPEGEGALSAALVYGGVKYGPQTRSLREGAQVVIGTPGRILDQLERKSFTLQNLRVLVLDEADEMLSMGFYPAMRELKRYLPRQRQSYMFSATIPHKVQSLSREFLNDPGFLSLSVGQESVSTIAYRYYVVDQMEKDRALARLIEMENPDSAIIFVNTKREVEYLGTFLKNYGYDADVISGDLSQKDRETVMDRIRRGTLKFLVATDVAARGIDISDLSHVFQYDVPQDPEYFLHRSGRTARAGKTGIAIILTTAIEERGLIGITHKYGVEAEKRPLPTQEDVEMRVAERMTEVLEELFREHTNMERERSKRFVPLVTQLAAEEPEMLAMLVDRLYHEQMHAVAPQPKAEAEPEAEPREARPAPEGGAPSERRGKGRGRGRSGERRQGGRERG